MIYTFIELGKTGIGKYRGRFKIEKVTKLMYFYCDRELNIDFKGLISQANNVKMIGNDSRWVDWERYSSRQKLRLWSWEIQNKEYKKGVGY